MKPSAMFAMWAAGWALAGTLADASAQAPQLQSESNTLRVVPSDGMFRTYGGGSQIMNEMRERLADPEQRAKLRQDQRQTIADSHYGVAETLQLDSATFDRLIELLADQQMEQSDYFHAMFFGGKMTGNPMERMRQEAERATRQIDALREVLGQEKLERYQTLRLSLGQRGRIRELDQRLGASGQLNTAQREQLVVLLHDQIFGPMERRHPPNSHRSLLHDRPRPMQSQEELQRLSQLRSIASHEQFWRDMPESNRQLRERAAKFLTEPQLAMLAQMHAEQQTSLQQRTEALRVEAGLSPTIPEQAQVVEAAPPATVDRDVKLSLTVAVNSGNPKYLTTVVGGGKPVSMKIADDLFLEATPIVFEDDVYSLRVEYFETGVTGKRLIGKMSQSGKVEQASENRGSRNVGGGGATVLTGSKGYAVELSALVEAT